MKLSDKKKITLVIGFIIWGLFVLGGYYLAHKPINAQHVVSIAKAVIDIALAFGLCLLGGAVGHRLLPKSEFSDLERFSIETALGLGILSLIWFLVGLLGLYVWWFAYLLMVVGFVFLWRDGYAWLKQLQEFRLYWSDTNPFGKILGAGCGLLVGGQLVYALSPPTKWDTLAYHLELPRQYLAAGRFLFLVDNPLWGRSQVAELLYTWAMALRGWETATVLGWCFSVVLLIGILGLVRRYSNITSAWVAATALLVGYTTLGMFSSGYVDGLAALFGLAVLVALIESVDSRKTKWLLWVGVFLGLSLGVKFTNGLLIPIGLLVVVIFRRKLGSRWWVYFLIICFLSVLLFLPWLLKNGLATGNPLYPHLWPTAWMDENRLGYYQGTARLTPLNWHDIFLPLSLTWFGIEGAEIVGIERYYADIGPLLLIFTLPGLVYKRKDPKARIVATWLLVGWLAMVIGGRITPLLWQTRYYYSLLPAAALAVGWGWEAIQGISVSGIRLNRIAGVLVTLVLVMAVWRETIDLVKQNPLGVVLGVRSEEEYLDAMLGYYGPATRALRDLPAGSKVVFLWDERGLYAPINAQADQLIDRWYFVRNRLGDPESILDHWQMAGFTHLLIYQSGMMFERQNRDALTADDWHALDDLLENLQPPIDFGGVYELYSLLP